MEYETICMGKKKRIAIVAHDNKKPELLEWAKENAELLKRHTLYTTGTTGTLLEKELGLDIHKLQSGPLGGDLQIGSMIAEGKIDLLIFLWDPLESQPHDPDIRALLRIAAVWDIPVACNRASADFIISSPLISGEYGRIVQDFSYYRDRFISK
ncbi:MAG: methylglyoxal synthase [Thermoplasmata archaeon HGW-Thermoplasmata-1]|nr:MAG: methylglyoxal synthase [Thermoplasmata archaeon HGW-Thermoplasmata-1]